MASVGMATQEPWRIALLGKAGAGLSTVAERIRADESSMKKEKDGRKPTGSKVTVVDTLGWDKRSMDHTLKTTKQDIMQIVTPGSHALLLVLPISVSGEVPSEEEIESHCQHIQLFTEAAWKYTIVLLSCQGQVEQSVINRHLRATEKLLEKCDKRHFILHGDTPISDLQQEIEDLVKGNNGGCLTLQDYCEGIVHENTELKKKLKDYEDVTKKRRVSSDIPPKFAEGKTVPQEQAKLLILLGSPALIVSIMAFAGAIFGLLSGATEGTPGSGLVRGFILGVFLAFVMLAAINHLNKSNPTVAERKPDTGVDPPEKSKKQ